MTDVISFKLNLSNPVEAEICYQLRQAMINRRLADDPAIPAQRRKAAAGQADFHQRKADKLLRLHRPDITAPKH